MAQTRLFVGNLPINFKEDELRTAFSNYGNVTNLDIKSKPAAENEASKFAFVTISSTNNEIEACIKHFSNTDFKGSKLYVTRARESFLERLQRERQENEQKVAEKNNPIQLSKHQPVINLGDRLNPRKRKTSMNENGIHPAKASKGRKEKVHTFKESEDQLDGQHSPAKHFKEPKVSVHKQNIRPPYDGGQVPTQNLSAADKKKLESDKKRMESMQKKRQEFKSKQQIIKTGLIGIDRQTNKKLRFSDTEEEAPALTENLAKPRAKVKINTLFEDDESDDEVNFEIKKQYEGKKGQKVLDLQSRYKSDKRFVLDERFIEDDESGEEGEDTQKDEDPSEHIDEMQGDEKSTQIKILEDVLGVAIKSHSNIPDKDRKIKPTMGMIRFDPMNPEHAKFVVPMEEVKQESKKSKKKLKEEPEPVAPLPEAPKVEVSKEQFYKSEITKEAFEQPAAGFSLRSLFTKEDDDTTPKGEEQEAEVQTIKPQKQQKKKNPLEPGERNPFVYDSSESEPEDEAKYVENNVNNLANDLPEVKAVWKENLFFSKDDSRLTDGLAFFNNVRSHEVPKERRELKSVMKKRIHNTERKNQMFKKKIGGRKKSMKKSYKKKS